MACRVCLVFLGCAKIALMVLYLIVMFRIVEDDMPPIPEGCSDLLKDFLEQCFDKDPTRRPNAEMLCEHPWLKKNWVAIKVCVLFISSNIYENAYVYCALPRVGAASSR